MAQKSRLKNRRKVFVSTDSLNLNGSMVVLDATNTGVLTAALSGPVTLFFIVFPGPAARVHSSHH
jgi:hypothetical protein